jgi:hypothetical protein
MIAPQVASVRWSMLLALKVVLRCYLGTWPLTALWLKQLALMMIILPLPARLKYTKARMMR